MDRLPDDVLALISSCLTHRSLHLAVGSLEQASQALRSVCLRVLWRLQCEALGLRLRPDAQHLERELGQGRSPWKDRVRLCLGDPQRSMFGGVGAPAGAAGAACAAADGGGDGASARAVR